MGERLLRRVALRRLFVGVRVRLTLWYLAILAVVFLVFSGVVIGTTLTNAANEERASLLSTASQLAGAYDAATGKLVFNYPWTSGDLASGGVREIDKQDTPLGPLDIALLLDSSGAVVQQFGPLTSDSVAQLEEQVNKWRSLGAAADQGEVESLPVVVGKAERGTAVDLASVAYDVYFTTIQRQGGPTATLVVGSQFDPGQTLRQLLPGLLIAGPLTLLLAAVGGYWLATRAMRPVRSITAAAREIGETDLHRRLRLGRRDELGELAATFDGMLDRLEAAFARQRQFTADASHELRTPLTIVDLEVTRALATRREPEEYARALETIRAENATMTRLVDDLLTLARADAGHVRLRIARVDLGDLALEVVERLGPLARERGLALEAGAMPEVIVRGDAEYLARMLGQLVENAIKYTAGVGSRVRVSVGRVGPGRAALRVEDDGPGIDAAHLPHLFERFYRVDESRGAGETVPGGSGLGLAVVEWIAAEHSGEARVRSAPGAGTTFEVLLPTEGDRGADTPA
jgi:signal transduction histidine kinase